MKKRFLAVAFGVATVTMLGGCTKQDLKETEHQADKAGDRAERGVKNAALTSAVKTKLAADVRLGTLTSINVDSDGSTVTLTGSVRTNDERSYTETVAKSVDGVSSVINRLEVKP